jgi:hypothetical protein
MGEAGITSQPQVDLTNLNGKKTVGLGHSFDEETVREHKAFDFKCGNVKYEDHRI